MFYANVGNERVTGDSLIEVLHKVRALTKAAPKQGVNPVIEIHETLGFFYITNYTLENGDAHTLMAAPTAFQA